MIGSTLNNAGLSTFQSGLTITGNVFNACLQVDPSTSTFNNNKFTNSVATDGTVLWPTDDTNISDLQFEICDNDIEYDASSDSTTPTFTNILHDDTGSDYDVNNTSGGVVTIALSGTSNANSYTGPVVTFSSSVILSIKVQDESKAVIENAQTSIFLLDSPYTQLMNEDTLATGFAEETYTGSKPVDIVYKSRKSETTDDPRYYAFSNTGQITSDGFSALITLKVNPNI